MTHRRARSAGPSLLAMLLRIHWTAALFAVFSFLLITGVAAVTTIDHYLANDQRLIARTLTYTLEAALIFDDRVVAQEELDRAVDHEQLEWVRVIRPEGQTWLTSHHPIRRLPGLLEWLNPAPAQERIMHQGRWIGTVELRADGSEITRLMAGVLEGMGASIIAIALGMITLNRRVRLSILVPLRELAAVAHESRVAQGSGRRVPSTEFQELRGLGEDFNALLDQVDAYQAKLTGENRFLSQLARYDELTGLANRRYFFEHLSEFIQRCQVEAGLLAVLYLDCDQFKAINDAHGHASGDLLLVEIAARIKTGLRDSDFVARLGGDEFVVLFTHARSAEVTWTLARKLQEILSQPLTLPSRFVLHPRVSMGIALYPDAQAKPGAGPLTAEVLGQEALLLVARADDAMYAAKKQTPGSICFPQYQLECGLLDER